MSEKEPSLVAGYASAYEGDIDEFFGFLELPVALRRDP